MIENPIYNPNSPYKDKSQAAKTAEYQVVKSMRFGFKWLEIGVKSTLKLGIDMIKQAFGKN